MSDIFSFEYVNYTDDDIDTNVIDYKKETKINKVEDYDKTTTETYRAKRLLKLDPLTDEVVPLHMQFSYPYKWNPYNGEITGIDPVGPLVFNAYNLYKYFLNNKLNGLWIPPINDENGNFEGYYGSYVGSGKNINIDSRGEHPQKYLFRLPIIDCYLPKNYNFSVITMGPLLKDDDINKIDSILQELYKNNYYPSIMQIKKLYDEAITNNYDMVELRKKYGNYLTDTVLKDKYNRSFVELLKNYKNIL